MGQQSGHGLAESSLRVSQGCNQSVAQGPGSRHSHLGTPCLFRFRLLAKIQVLVVAGLRSHFLAGCQLFSAPGGHPPS